MHPRHNGTVKREIDCQVYDLVYLIQARILEEVGYRPTLTDILEHAITTYAEFLEVIEPALTRHT